MSLTGSLRELEEVEEPLPEPKPLRVALGPSTSRTGFVRAIARQPLVHFLLAGIALFAGASLFEKRTRNSNEIRVSSVEIQRLQDVWSRQYGRTPTSAELRNLVDEHVREEIYYREAVASGLDKDDSIIRRRLVEKMEFLSQEVASGEPTEKELQDYFARNREKFRLSAQIAFTHVYFSPSKRGPDLQNDAMRSLAELRNAKSSADQASKLGDAFMLQSEYPLQTLEEVRSLFGAEFSNAIFNVRPGQWEGPIRSSYGLHLVRITQYQLAHAPELNDVRAQVMTDFKNDRLQAATEKYYARLRQRYQVKVDEAGIAPVANSSPSTRAAEHSEAPTPDVY